MSRGLFVMRGEPSTARRTRFGVAVSLPRLAAGSGSASGAASARGDLAPGACVGHYELIRELGRGGMGVVYAARDTRLGRRVAMKFLLAPTRDVAERFLIEARATARCSHPNIVIIHEVAADVALPYMVLELLDGRSLREVMVRAERLPPSRVIELAQPVARALAHAHEQGLVHRDLKPENVFVASSGQIKVLDFGIAKALGSEDLRGAYAQAAGGLNLTREGAWIGTLPYMSPEQIGAGEVDHRADLWAVGVMLFEMLAGRHPVEPLTVEALVANAVDDTPLPSIRELVPETPVELAAIVDACLRKRRHERLPSARELVRRLDELVPAHHARALASGESPFPGLQAFQEADAGRFFGRTRDIARAVARIREAPLIAVVGPSGIGKSSFLRAGVAPALKASGERWEVVTLRPGKQPLEALASIARRLTTRSGGDAQTELDEHRALVRALASEPGQLGALLRRRALQLECSILLVVDQFEELYTLVIDPEERRAFTAALAGIADDVTSPLRVALSMRADFLDRAGSDPDFLDQLTAGLLVLSAPDAEGLREALVQPVELAGHRYESPSIVDDMLAALADTTGALPLLQFAAAKLWDARDRERRLITHASYQRVGGIAGALAAHADDVVAAMDTAAQSTARALFRRLVTPERTRAIVELADLEELGPDRTHTARIVELLVAARLLVIQSRGDASGTIELVHEALIARWPALQRWLDDDREDASFRAQLAATAKQWDARGRPPGLLWRGEAADEARRWVAHGPRELAPRDRAFVDAVLALARRSRRIRRAALIGAFAALACAATFAGIGFLRVRAAEQDATANAQLAEDQAARARAALARMQDEERERRAAEQRQQDAERRRVDAETDRQRATVEVDESREQLRDRNLKLEAALREAGRARDRAERAMSKAEQSAASARAAETELGRALDRERARVRELEDQKRKLSTKLSD